MNPPKKQVLLLNPFADICYEAKTEEEGKILNSHIVCQTPLGLSYIYTYAKKKLKDFDFHILDGQAILFENASKGMEANWNILLEKIKHINPSAIGIGAYFYRAAILFHETCKRIKEALPSTIIVAGGNYATDATDLIMKDKNVDFTILSEGDITFVECLEKYFSNGDLSSINGFAYRDNKGLSISPKTNFIKDLNILPIPDRTQLPMNLYGQDISALDRVYDSYKMLNMTISRGCANACTFCIAKQFWGRKIRYRDMESVLEEMRILKEEYGADIIAIDDDNFLLNKKEASRIMKEMIKRNLNVKWLCSGGTNVRVLNNDDDYLDLVIKSGYCFFNLAIESSSNETLKKIKKPVTAEESESLIKKVRSKYPGVYLNAFFMIGFPFETKQDILNTFDFSEKLELDWSTFHTVNPYPNTEFYDYCVENKIIEPYGFVYGKSNKRIEEIFQQGLIDGGDWTSDWLSKMIYKHNLKINFLNNRNLRYKEYIQALRDFEYIITLVPNHALAYRQAAYCSKELNNIEKYELYSNKEKEILANDSEFLNWYKELSLDY